MAASATDADPPPARELTLTRLIDAPRDLVFQMWTERQHLQRWWGPKGFTNPVCEIDARKGGKLRIVMRGPDGRDHTMTGTFLEFAPPERIVFTNIAVDADGKAMLDGLTTVTFAEKNGKTRLTVETRAIGLVTTAPAMLAGMDAGWNQSLDRLADLIQQH